MSHSRRLTFLAAAATNLPSALSLAARGGRGTTAATPLPITDGHVATVGAGKTNLGTILIDRTARLLPRSRAEAPPRAPESLLAT